MVFLHKKCNFESLSEFTQIPDIMKTYHSPKTEVFEIHPSGVVCQSVVSLTNFGEEGAAGGAINEENTVNGGIF